ncbi:sla2 Src-like adaptor 2 [Haplosporangium bisporale]|nr:sla2 Src-like adaptor 2 [Haplosporangium bisporale]
MSRPLNRDKAEADLVLHIKKATSPEETAPKQKHVRACIVYTHDFRSSAAVWQGFRSQPMLGDEVQTFKALVCVHKIICDGHPVTLKDAQKQTDWLDQCARSTQQFDSRGYSTLIRAYVEFLHSKLRYHNNHPEFSGNFDYNEYVSLKGIDDPNEGYETINDLMNLQDQIDQFQKLVFANFRPASNNECRISAFVPLVQESYNIYKFATSMLRAMHRHQINIWKSKYEALAKLYSQLRQEHLDLLGKFKTVQLKANSAQEAMDKFEKMQKEIKDKNLQMADMVRERDRAKNELLRWQNTQNDEIARLKRDLEMANGRVEDLGRSKSSEVGSMVAKFNKEKQDLEDLANRRQREIDDLMRRVEDQRAQIERMQIENEEEKAVLESGLDETLAELASLQHGQSEQSSTLQARIDSMTRAHKTKMQKILDSILETCISKVEESVFDLESPTQLGNQNATPEFTLSMIEKAHTASTEFELALLQYLSPSGDTNQVDAIRSALALSQTISDVLGNAKGITRLAKNDQDAEDIFRHAKSSAVATQEFFTNVMSSRLGGLSPEGSIKTIERSNEGVQSAMERLAKAAEHLIPKSNQLDPSKLDLGDMVEMEMGNAAKTIEEATARLQALMAKPKNNDLSAIELQVNASILESAMAMMQAIGHLIKCATISQQEVVAQGRGNSTNAAFYKKNNRWTEGLISAAKAVAMATTLLVETADGVISKTHSMEQLLVASNEVAAATAQLVAASRVKANFMSKAQDNLERASKAVTEASRALVRAVKAIMDRELKKREGAVDYQNMNAHEFKIKEMGQQVEILKLEKELTLARRVLGEMRKVSYHQGDD